MEFFILPELCNVWQLMFLTVVYSVVLYQSSNLIATGSSYLVLFPSVSGIVGSVVLPILGAVPDGTMVLFSGLGTHAQEQVSVGVGALAGSTVMLLTFPWFIAVMFGRVPVVNGEPQYGRRPEEEGKGGGFCSGGISYTESLQKAAKIMLATTLLYLVIQIPATIEESETSDTLKQASAENTMAGVGLLMCILAFCGYLYYCFKDANEDKVLAKVVEGIKKKKITIGAALRFAKDTGTQSGPGEKLCPAGEARLKKIVWPFFARLDTDGSRSLDLSEFKNLLIELGESPKPKASAMFSKRDVNKDKKLDFNEVVSFLAEYLEEANLVKLKQQVNPRYMPAYDEEEEEEEMPEDLADMPPHQQMRRLLMRSLWMMGLGTLLVLVFSDPMVDILSEWGNRFNIDAFYVSFVLAPFASNASELLSAYTYAIKKSQKSMTTSLSTLIGAACMNNTFCLAVFFALIYFKNLAWQFTAETLAIVLIQWVIGLLVLSRKTQDTLIAFIILFCYPGCLLIVWFFTNIMGWD